MNINSIFSIGLFSVLLSINASLASSLTVKSEILEKDSFIDQVIRAYGNENLSVIKSLRISDRYKVFSIDQGANPEVNSISLLYSTLNVDFNSGKKSVKNWSQGTNGTRLSEILFDGQTGWSINHLRGTYVENKNLNGEVVGAGMMRMIDTILARRLQVNRDTAVLISHSSLAGRSIYTLSFKDRNKNQFFLDVEASSGLILRMSQNEDRTTGRVYEFGKHRKIQGLVFATDMNMLVDGEPRFVTSFRNIEVDKNDHQSFLIPKDSIKLKGMINRSEMNVQKLADKVYLAGKDSNFSIFVDAGDFYVGGGGLAGLTKRLEAVNRFVGDNKPLKIQVIPDHHRGHLGAIKELEEMGSRIVIACQNLSIIESLGSKNNRNDEHCVIDEKMDLASGLVEVHEINTVHAENYLLFYIPSAKLVFSADHFGTNLIDALPGANRTVKTFHSEIKRLGIQVEKYAHAHGPRILSAGDLERVLSGYQLKSCPSGQKICMDYPTSLLSADL